jgi:hypothetical protein
MTAKNRMPTSRCGDIEAEATRLGGSEPGGWRWISCEHGSSWVRMADPEGNEFCLCEGGVP